MPAVHALAMAKARVSQRATVAGSVPPLAPTEKPAMDDFDDHLSTIFPEVRLKTFLEMRGADAGQQAGLCALSAFWVGLLYDETALDGAWELVKGWNAAERQALRTDTVDTTAPHWSPPSDGGSAPLA